MKTPFNLEQFKSGVPAITRDGRVAIYDSEEIYTMYVNIGKDSISMTDKGERFYGSVDSTDLLYMQEPAKETQSTKSINEKRYEWLKSYQLSRVTIPQFEKEVAACVSSDELDKVVDKYSSIISFNKE